MSISHRFRRSFVDLSLCLVTHRGGLGQRDFIRRIIQAVEGGVRCVQIRDGEKDVRASIESVREIKKLFGSDVCVIMNNRADVAAAAGADGLHIGQRDLPYSMARELLGPDAVIGLSIDTWDDLIAAQRIVDVDYLGISQLFRSRTKPDYESLWGLDGLRKAREFSKHRLVPIGGITLENLPEVADRLKKGDGVAAIGKLWEDPANYARKMKEILCQHEI